MRPRAVCASLCLAALPAGCKTNPTGLDGQPIVDDLAHVVAQPTHEDLRKETAALALALSALETSPDPGHLEQAQDAWRAARKPWKQCQTFGFGPVETLGLAGPIDWWPAKPSNIENEIESDSPATADRIAKLGTSSKGMMALEYLLFDPGGDDAAVVAAFAGAGGANRRAYARALGEDLEVQTSALADAWDPAHGDYAGQLARAGHGSDSFATTHAAIDTIVNQIVVLTETVADKEIGKPFGKAAGGEVQPDQEVASRSDNSIDDLLDELRGIQNVYRGTYAGADGAGVIDLLAGDTAALGSETDAVIAAALESVAAIPRPFRTALTEHPKEVEAAWQSVKTMKQKLGTEVVSALGVTLKFNANDGD